MTEWTLQFRELTLLSVILRPLVAVVLSGFIGLERGLKNRAAGFRTYMLVSLGASLIMCTNQYVYQMLGVGDPVRMGAQVISGIGFLGAGSIIVTSRSQIKGLTTAAGLWCSACVGLAVGIGFFEVAIMATLCIILVLTIFHSLENFMRRNTRVLTFFVELNAGCSIREFLTFADENGILVSNLQMEPSRFLNEESIGFLATAKPKRKIKKPELIQTLEDNAFVQYFEEL